jgi:Zn-dependent metalloprotease
MVRLAALVIIAFTAIPTFAAIPAEVDLTGLVAAAGPDARIERHPATGTVRLLVLDRAAGHPATAANVAPEAAARQFLVRHGSAFGVAGPEALTLADVTTDQLGHTHVRFRQNHSGIPVIGGEIQVHLDPQGAVRVVNGVFVPVLQMSTVPSVSASSARTTAVESLAAPMSAAKAATLAATPATLSIWRENLVRGLPGRSVLVWDLEVADGVGVRERVLVDATGGTIVERLNLVHDLSRTISQREVTNVVWQEGDELPYTAGTSSDNAEINELITVSQDTYTFFANLSGGSFLSWNGRGATMRSVQDVDYDECPNAFWNGSSTNYCDGMVTDDIAAHEWTHAYTGSTHGLIYQWQPGALNEAYSDIFGETIDLMNNRGGDSPDALRTPDTCSIYGGAPPALMEVTAPASVAGDYSVGNAVFNPTAPWSADGRLAAANDGGQVGTDGCESFVDFTAGRIALVDRGQCTFRTKVENAIAAGATGVVVVNNQGNGVITMGGEGGRLSIPAVMVGQADGNRLRDALARNVMVSISQSPPSDASRRWLVGEDLGGGIRDMWMPGCYGDPGAVTDGRYFCSEDDNGGVHTNSGVINRAYALSVDGFDGWDGIGLVRASHIWWRAMSAYQVPTTDFTAHADLVEISCADLVGLELVHPMTGQPSGDTITAGDCAVVAAAFDEVRARAQPTQCGFAPLLAPDAPEVAARVTLLDESFATDPGWERNNEGVYAEYDPRDWVHTQNGPEGHEGDGMLYALNSISVGNCQPGSDDQSGVMWVDTPAVTVGSGAVTLLIDHYHATESEWDGGVVEISRNGGAFEPVPGSAFDFNGYNLTLRQQLEGNTNPLAGREAFSGTDQGTFSGSWGQSIVTLSDIAAAGDEVVLRFILGVDGCNGREGWYLDRVGIVAEGAGPRRGEGRSGGGV